MDQKKTTKEMLVEGKEVLKKTKAKIEEGIAAYRQLEIIVMMLEIQDKRESTLQSKVTGENVNPETGKDVNDDGKVTDLNGWKKENLH